MVVVTGSVAGQVLGRALPNTLAVPGMFLGCFYDKAVAVDKTGMLVIFGPSYWRACQRHDRRDRGRQL